MGSCCDTEEAPASPVRPTQNFPAHKDKSFVIIGAGPAGVHMASILLRKGYKNVVILEKQAEDRINIGKSMTVPDEMVNEDINNYDDDRPIVHELGTCYLHPEYFVIQRLLDEYDPENKELRIPSRALFFNQEKDAGQKISKVADDGSRINKKKRIYDDSFTFSQWVFSEAERLAYPKGLHWLPDKISGGAAWVDAQKRYNNLHEQIFGKQENNKKHGFLGKPKGFDDDESVRALINCTFLEYLERNKMRALIPTFVYSQSVQGYGTLDTLPAFYGLFWNTPELLKQITDFKRVLNDEPNVTCLSKGFGSIWQNMIDQLKIDIRYETNITGIDRHLDDEKSPIEVKFVRNGKSETMECDFLFIAAGMHKIIDHKTGGKDCILEDVTQLEKDIWLDMEAQTLAATLYEFDVTEDTIDDAAVLMHPNKIWHADGALYARRNSAKCLLGIDKYTKLCKDGKIKRDRTVGYQFLSREPQEGDKEMLLQKLEEHAKEMELENLKVLKQEVWDYFPIWTQDGINKGYPWKVKNEMQGKYKNTFYIGSSVCFESVLNVVEYNNELDHKFQF